MCTFYIKKKLPSSYQKNCIGPPYKKLEPLKSASLGWQGTSATSALPTTGTSPSQEILVAEMEKAADAADTSVLFFSAGANF